ncbi:SDR family oxidoreductase [Shewanella insulae]|nr:SDR family oxidoreductase [Shewanella insulae]MCG9755628.1 SDR family oxidoreductase [Shewanella insulae]
MTMNKWALVTGGAKRIGEAIALTLHKRDYNLLLHYKGSKAEAMALADKLNQMREGSCQTLQADLSTERGVESLVQHISTHRLPLSALINNASLFVPDNKASDWQTCQQLLNLNLLAPYHLATRLGDNLANNRGSVINLVDIHGDRPLKHHGLYSISKAGLKMATQALAQELAPKVRVNGISPGAILWPAQSDQDAIERVTRAIPLERPGKAKDIADAVSFILDSSYLNGQVIAIDGGRSATGYTGADG